MAGRTEKSRMKLVNTKIDSAQSVEDQMMDTSKYIFTTLKTIHSEKLQAERQFRTQMIDYQSYVNSTVKPLPKLNEQDTKETSPTIIHTRKPKQSSSICLQVTPK